jgi:hypothetical protein
MIAISELCSYCCLFVLRRTTTLYSKSISCDNGVDLANIKYVFFYLSKNGMLTSVHIIQRQLPHEYYLRSLLIDARLDQRMHLGSRVPVSIKTKQSPWGSICYGTGPTYATKIQTTSRLSCIHTDVVHLYTLTNDFCRSIIFWKLWNLTVHRFSRKIYTCYFTLPILLYIDM